IELRYTALSFRKPSRVVMRYRLEGHDREWIDAGTQRVAFYTSLSPGSYRFVVIAGNEDGVWNEDGAAVEVYIEPHFYQTPVFYVLCALAALGGAAGLHRFRIRHLKRREQELARRVEEGVAEHRRMVEALRASEARLAEAQRVARLGTWEWSIDDDELVWSQEMYRIYGRSEQLGPLAKFWLQATHPEDRDGVAERFEQALAGHGDFSLDYRIVVMEKTVRWVHAEADVARDEQGRAVRVIGTTLDITERKHEEERRRKFETQLLETQKLESLGMLAGGIAHQFNNLLVGILGNAGLALMELSQHSPVRELIEQIEKTGLRASDLSAQMLAFSGKGRFVVEPADLSAEVRGMAHLLAASISKKVGITYALAPDLPAIDADVPQIRQMVMNVIINASEAIGDAEGTITVTTGTMECDREYLSATHLDEDLPAGPYNYLEIADSGCGMDEETRAKLFEPFFSTKFTGRGLGLAAVLGIVRGHRGAIKVESEPFRGSKIRVLLPCSARAPVTETAARVTSSAPEWRGSGTVLLVDDEEPVRLTARAILETLGFEVMTAADGRECVDAYERHGDEIRLVVLDHSMPRMAGVEVFRELRRLRSDVRVILCSGYSERDVTEDLAGEDLDGFLHKPYQLDTLREKIREVLDR
ncbi:MAG: response regulator, partial [bacterium]|nr:response regulator [bacterium]